LYQTILIIFSLGNNS